MNSPFASHKLVVVDAFTDRPFSGNPAAVCLLSAPAPESWMRGLAREMNLSETAFLHPEKTGLDGRPEFRLRWLTPEDEVNLCGHATLASAHVLWTEAGAPSSETLRFHTKSGLLTAKRESSGEITLDFPVLRTTPADPAHDLIEAMSSAGSETPFAPVACERYGDDYLFEMPCEAAVRSCRPNFQALALLDARGVIVTARADANKDGTREGEPDIVSRFFAPKIGVPEDPVTGSAHCALGPYWATKLGKDHLRAEQASARGGRLDLALRGERIAITGRAVTVWRGQLAETGMDGRA